jgi:hypothetical protein
LPAIGPLQGPIGPYAGGGKRCGTTIQNSTIKAKFY